MPELPEVETTLRGIAPYLEGRLIQELVVRERRLRHPVPPATEAEVAGQKIMALRRRAKYLIFDLERGSILVHLGMSGSLRLVPVETPAGTHDHIDLIMADRRCLRFRDPRRFGLFLWLASQPESHSLLSGLGPEPLGPGFDGAYLFHVSRGRTIPIKALIMDAKVVVGIGNIYASEALFLAAIRPDRPAAQIDEPGYERLAYAIRQVLSESIAAGGTSLRDFVREDGHPGYYARRLRVYARDKQPCVNCGSGLERMKIGQRSSFFCPSCQQ